MTRTESSSSSPRNRGASWETERLLRVPLDRLLPHPSNANRMGEERLQKLAQNIQREGDYPPLVVRPHPEEEDCYQLLDGHQRADALRRLGRDEASCYVWPCNHQTALVLLATLNRLEGQDDPLRRAELLRELSELVSPDELTQLLPENTALLRQSLDLLDLNLEELLASLERETSSGNGPRAISFVVSRDDDRMIEETVQAEAAELEGADRRGRALAAICRRSLEVSDD